MATRCKAIASEKCPPRSHSFILAVHSVSSQCFNVSPKLYNLNQVNDDLVCIVFIRPYHNNPVKGGRMNAYGSRQTCLCSVRRTAVWFSIVLLSLSALGTELASAEMYIAGQVGYASPHDLSDIKGTGNSSGITSTDLALKSGIAYGAKIGGYSLVPPDGWDWSLKASITNPTSNLKQPR